MIQSTRARGIYSKENKMSSFDDRKSAFEKRFAHDQELEFKVEARCCKLFGLWMAEKLGLSGADADTYAKGVVSANLEEPGYDDVIRHVMPDIQGKGIDISEHMLNTMLDKFTEEAKIQVMEETANDN
jgi:hypothetical protein